MAVAADPIEAIQQQNLEVYRVAPGRLREDVSQEAQVAHDYRGRLAYELLQNADDAMEAGQAEGDRVAFLVTDDELWVANTGRPFSVEDVQALCGLGASSKVDAEGTRRASIGHKGLGFKSVLEITDTPTAYSTTYSFQLGEIHARRIVEPLIRSGDLDRPRRLPAMRFPVAVDDQPDEWRAFQRGGCNTAFRFPFAQRMTTEDRARVGALLLELPVTTVLFLKNLDEVSVTVDQEARSETRYWRTRRRSRRNGRSGERVDALQGSGLYEVQLTVDEQDTFSFLLAHDASVPIGQHRDGLSGPAWEGVDLSEVSVAVLDPDRSSGTMPEAWRRFHVFLPTAEPCPYPMLVNGAFMTDLSRQRVAADGRRHDYNSHLVREAARLFRHDLAPALAEASPERLLATLDRGAANASGVTAASLLHESLADALADYAFIPSGGTHLTLPECLVPPIELAESAPRFRVVLQEALSVDGRRLPDPDVCAQHLAAVLEDHGAVRLSAADALTLLAQHADPERASLEDHSSGGFALDPVLELASSLWSNASGEVREMLEVKAKQLPLFPIRADGNGHMQRVTLGGRSAFYPPQSARQKLPLSGLAFMFHELCWGALQPNERKSYLEDRMTIWRALFGISEFRFEEVMRAAVLPGLVLHPEGDAQALREELENRHALAAICQLAGKQPKPDRPLRYQRLRSDRALFNLSRLPVPCRAGDGAVRWVPAYRAYFGRDWVGEGSVEDLLDVVNAGDGQLELPLLASPEFFDGLLDGFSDVAPTEDADDDAQEDDEVGMDEDLDEPVETDERTRWTAFLAWLGVNPCLRPVHFHDVEDDTGGWLKTYMLRQPQGWAFRDLSVTWEQYSAYLHEQLERGPDADEVDPYLYECHDLEGLAYIIERAESDASATISKALFEHLAFHWDTYGRFESAQLALVAKGKWPSSRSKPQRARAEEKHDIGDDLWLFRLRRAACVPTSHGPRRPATTWMPGSEAERRFGRGGRSAGDVLPLVEVDATLDARRTRALADRLGVKLDLSPSAFGIGDAEALARRLAELYAPGRRQIDAAALRSVIRPTYRQLFELLSGTDASSDALHRVPMLASTPGGYAFEEAADVLYVRSPGIKERSGVGGKIPTFVLEAEPAANAQLGRLFGMRALEDALEWKPSPGEPALSGTDLDSFRRELRRLLPVLLARLRAERPSSALEDRLALTSLVDVIEPVTELEVACEFGGATVAPRVPRPYFVAAAKQNQHQQAFLAWDGEPWPPGPDEQQALAMCLADALGVNLVETFLAFLDGTDEQRYRLLDLAGASSYLEEIDAELRGSVPVEPETIAPPETGEKSAAPESGSRYEVATGSTPDVPSAPAPGLRKVPLVAFESLEIAGEISLVQGQAEADGANRGGQQGSPSKSKPQAMRLPGRAAPGTDLSELDALGMKITMAFELHRLRQRGLEPTLLDRDAANGGTGVIDVSTPSAIQNAIEVSSATKRAFEWLRQHGVSELYPGFDVLTLVGARIDRLIELKSSGVDARVQAMSWNEWKSARSARLRERFWLYLVGNLRQDLPAAPYVRAVHDPFGSLLSQPTEQRATRRTVQLLVREFEQAEELILDPTDEAETSPRRPQLA